MCRLCQGRPPPPSGPLSTSGTSSIIPSQLQVSPPLLRHSSSCKPFCVTQSAAGQSTELHYPCYRAWCITWQRVWFYNKVLWYVLKKGWVKERIQPQRHSCCHKPYCISLCVNQQEVKLLYCSVLLQCMVCQSGANQLAACPRGLSQAIVHCYSACHLAASHFHHCALRSNNVLKMVLIHIFGLMSMH